MEEMDGWIALEVKYPEPETEVELMSISQFAGMHRPDDEEQWVATGEVTGNITHWRPLSTNSEEIGSELVEGEKDGV